MELIRKCILFRRRLYLMIMTVQTNKMHHTTDRLSNKMSAILSLTPDQVTLLLLLLSNLMSN